MINEISAKELTADILQRLEHEAEDFLAVQNPNINDIGIHVGRQQAYEIVLREIWDMTDKLDKQVDKEYRDGKFN